MKTKYWLLAALAALLVVGYLVYACRDNSVAVVVSDKIDATPTQITAMKEIGEWEFLVVHDEELVDTVRKGVFTDDSLIRIYYGTLRLGFDTHDAPADWLTVHGDTAIVRLPAIRLLSDEFIDEARTQSFFETGRWSDADRKALAERAALQMKQRCFTKANIQSAGRNAVSHFQQMMKALGYHTVNVTVEESR